jgi:hypothetical protein
MNIHHDNITDSIVYRIYRKIDIPFSSLEFQSKYDVTGRAIISIRSVTDRLVSGVPDYILACSFNAMEQ